MNLRKHRPLEQNSANIKLNHSVNNPEQYIKDSFKPAKSEPDLLDSKYVNYRRPWYVNPEYKGPKNRLESIAISPSISHADSVRALVTVNKLKASLEKLIAEENVSENSKDFEVNKQFSTSQSCVVIPDHLDKASYFSYDNLLEVKNENKNNESRYFDNLSSSPESVFSFPNSSTCLSDKKSNLSSKINIKRISNNPLVTPNDSKSSNSNSYHENQNKTGYISMTKSASPSTNDNTSFNFPDNFSRHSLMSNEENFMFNRINLLSAGSYQGLHDNPNQPLSRFIVSSSTKRNTKSSTASSQQFRNNTRKKPFVHTNSSLLTRISDFSSINLPRFIQTQNEVLMYIFSYLDIKSLTNCGVVCKQWYTISRNPILWKKIRIKDKKMSDATFKIFSRWCTELSEISLENISPLDESSSKKQKSNFESNLEELLVQNKTTLKVVRVVDCDQVIKGHIFWPLSIHCNKLVTLIYLSKTNPLGQEDLFPLGKGCPKITSLIIPPGWPCSDPNKFNDACCETIAKCWPKLQVLCIGGRLLTIKGLSFIAKGCIKLQQLEIDHGPEITEDVTTKLISYGLRGLESLDFTFTPVSPRAIVLFNNACPKLDHIGIHCNIFDYFTDSASSKAKANFSSLKTLFKRLKLRSGFSKVLDINLDYNLDS